MAHIDPYIIITNFQLGSGQNLFYVGARWFQYYSVDESGGYFSCFTPVVEL